MNRGGDNLMFGVKLDVALYRLSGMRVDWEEGEGDDPFIVTRCAFTGKEKHHSIGSHTKSLHNFKSLEVYAGQRGCHLKNVSYCQHKKVYTAEYIKHPFQWSCKEWVKDIKTYVGENEDEFVARALAIYASLTGFNYVTGDSYYSHDNSFDYHRDSLIKMAWVYCTHCGETHMIPTDELDIDRKKVDGKTYQFVHYRCPETGQFYVEDTSCSIESDY